MDADRELTEKATKALACEDHANLIVAGLSEEEYDRIVALATRGAECAGAQECWIIETGPGRSQPNMRFLYPSSEDAASALRDSYADPDAWTIHRVLILPASADGGGPK